MRGRAAGLLQQMSGTRKILVIGNSHINALRLAQSVVEGNCVVDYLHAGWIAWQLCVVMHRNGTIRFARDPLEVIAEFEHTSLQQGDSGRIEIVNTHSGARGPVPGNVCHLRSPGKPVPRPRRFNAVVLIGLAPRPIYDRFFEHHLVGEGPPAPGQIPISFGLARSLRAPLNGNARVLVRPSFIAVIDPDGDIRGLPAMASYPALLTAVSACFPDAHSISIARHPSFPDSASAGQQPEERRMLNRQQFNRYQSRLHEELGYAFRPTPAGALCGDGLHTRTELSLDLAARNPHLNREYGNLLWREVLRHL